MKPSPLNVRHWANVLLSALTLIASNAANAAPREVEAFDTKSWPALQREIKQPTIMVFSATWCSICPDVIDRLRQDIDKRKLKASLMVTLMDVAPGDRDAALLRDAHYTQTDRLFAFDGQANAVRYSVDKRWLGITPYVVLLAPNAAPVAITGAPAASEIDAWLRASAAAASGAAASGAAKPVR